MLLSKLLTNTLLANGLTNKLLPTEDTLTVTKLLIHMIAQLLTYQVVPLWLTLLLKELLINTPTFTVLSLMQLDGGN